MKDFSNRSHYWDLCLANEEVKTASRNGSQVYCQWFLEHPWAMGSHRPSRIPPTATLLQHWLPQVIAVSPQMTHRALLLDCLMLKMAGTQILWCLSPQEYLFHATRIFCFSECYVVFNIHSYSSGSLRTLSLNNSLSWSLVLIKGRRVYSLSIPFFDWENLKLVSENLLQPMKASCIFSPNLLQSANEWICNYWAPVACPALYSGLLLPSLSDTLVRQSMFRIIRKGVGGSQRLTFPKSPSKKKVGE